MLFRSVTADTLCRVTVTGDSVMYHWRHQGMVTSDNVTLALDIGHSWHSVNVEHNSVETSLIVDRKHLSSLANNNNYNQGNHRDKFYLKV